MIAKHKTNESYMFCFKDKLVRFSNYKARLDASQAEAIKKTLDYSSGLIEVYEPIKKVVEVVAIKQPIIKPQEEKSVKKTPSKPKKKTTPKRSKKK